MYINRSLKEYLDDLSARKPAPGGGSAAALSAAIGVSLMSMVANYTTGNPKYKDVEKDAAGLLLRLEKYRDRLQDLIDEDIEAYNKLAWGLKTAGKDGSSLQGLYKDGIKPPLEVCEIACECLKLCAGLAAFGNKNLITDTAIAAIMLEGAFFSAKYNVYINLRFINDMKYIETIHNVLSPLETEVPRLKEEILEKCEDVINK